MLFQCVFRNARVSARGDTGVSECGPDIEFGESTVARTIGGRICLVWSGGVICCHRKRPDTGFQRVRNSELFRCRVFSCFVIVSWRVSGGFRVRLVPGMCVST